MGRENTCCCPQLLEEERWPAEPTEFRFSYLIEGERGGLWVSAVWPIYTRLEICMWQGFPTFSANLCSEFGFSVCQTTLRTRRSVPQQDWRQWFRTTGNFNCGSLRVYWNKLQPRFSLESFVHVNSRLVFADKSPNWHTLARCRTLKTRTSDAASGSSLLSQTTHTCPRINLALWPCAAQTKAGCLIQHEHVFWVKCSPGRPGQSSWVKNRHMTKLFINGTARGNFVRYLI